MKSDIQIAQESTIYPITDVASNFGLDLEDLEFYGKYKAKINDSIFESSKNNQNSKLVLVSAINPTPAGEGKTTTTIGLAQGLNLLGKKTVVALREPSLGPCMGLKGGAAGGGFSQVLPMEEINLHFTGDLHAITSAHNLLSAMLDNHLHFGNELDIDVSSIIWKRAVDMNDRSLRNIIIGVGGKPNGVTREDGFIITVASEVMAILCLSENLADLKEKLGKIIVAYNRNGDPVTAKDLNANNAMAALLKEAIKPNLVQTIEHTPAIIHGGPFANIAHGCNSIKATKIAMAISDICITEAGFGADLGAEKFFNIKCRKGNLHPDCVVLVATIRALKYNGGSDLKDLKEENLQTLESGFQNLEKHIENIKKFNVPIVVALNSFLYDTENEINLIKSLCEKNNVDFAKSDVWEKGGEGGIELGKMVLNILENKPSNFNFLYDLDDSVENKIKKIATEIYGADDVLYLPKAKKAIEKINELGFSNLPICIAKTQSSLSDNPKLLGRPKNFNVTVKDINLSAGAGFIVVLLGDVMTMPGLPKVPSATNIDIDENNNIIGLF